MQFYDSDPENGGKEISISDFLNQSGLSKRLEKKGFVFNPIHSFELLKDTRQTLFEEEKQRFKEKRSLNHLETSQFDISCLYVMWLGNELKVIDKWLSDKYPNGKAKPRPSNSDQIEIMKYKQFVTTEIEEAKKILILLRFPLIPKKKQY